MPPSNLVLAANIAGSNFCASKNVSASSKFIAGSKIPVNLTVYRCSKVAANLTVFFFAAAELLLT